MRVRLVGKGTRNGLKMGSDIQVLIVPDDSEPRTDHIPIDVEIDPENPDLGYVFYVDGDG